MVLGLAWLNGVGWLGAGLLDGVKLSDKSAEMLQRTLTAPPGATAGMGGLMAMMGLGGAGPPGGAAAAGPGATAGGGAGGMDATGMAAAMTAVGSMLQAMEGRINARIAAAEASVHSRVDRLEATLLSVAGQQPTAGQRPTTPDGAARRPATATAGHHRPLPVPPVASRGSGPPPD